MQLLARELAGEVRRGFGRAEKTDWIDVPVPERKYYAGCAFVDGR